MHDQKTAALTFLMLGGVDRAAEGAGLCLCLAARDNHEARAGRLIEGVADFVDVHMTDKLTVPRGDIAVLKAEKYRAAEQVTGYAALTVGVGVGEHGTAARALEQAL